MEEFHNNELQPTPRKPTWTTIHAAHTFHSSVCSFHCQLFESIICGHSIVCVCVCVCTCVYVCVCMCVCVCVHTCMFMPLCVYMYAYVHLCICTCMDVCGVFLVYFIFLTETQFYILIWYTILLPLVVSSATVVKLLINIQKKWY